jgi:hypothetical protein
MSLKPVSICTGAAQARKHRVRVDASATQITTPSTQPRASATNNHARKSSCAGWGPIAAQQLPALSDLSNWVPPPHSARPLHGRSVHAGSICGHWPAPKPSRIPSPACMHKHGKLARVRWPRVPAGGVYPYRRSEEGIPHKLTLIGKVTPKAEISETDDVFPSTLKRDETRHRLLLAIQIWLRAACTPVPWGCQFHSSYTLSFRSNQPS